MKVFVNGKEYNFKHSEIKLNDLLSKLEMTSSGLVAELDGNTFPNNEFEDKVVKDGSRLELMRIVGGG